MFPKFLLFWCNVIIVTLYIKRDSTVICVPCMLQHVSYKPFSLKKIADLEDISF